MTSLLRTKLRTTAPRITRLRTVAKIVALALFTASPAIAQQPTPQTSPVQRSISTSGGGRVLYFQKPADSQATLPDAAPTAIPNSSSLPNLIPGPTSASPAPIRTYTPTAAVAEQQPPPSTSQKKQIEIPPPRPEWTTLPIRTSIFTMKDDQQLELLVLRAIANDYPPIKVSQLGFPDLTPIRDNLSPPGKLYQAKTINYDPRQGLYEPGYILHRRLYFNEANAERYGWDFGFIQPVVSAAFFFKDFVLIPNSVGTNLVTGFWDTNAGKCLPGNSVPYIAYPPGLSITGSIFEAGVIVGLSFIIP